MFTFHWSALLVVVLGGLALFFGLALLMLRRRMELLQDLLTPEEPDLEEDFFRVRETKQAETEPEDTLAEPEVSEAAEEETVRWGIPNA